MAFGDFLTSYFSDTSMNSLRMLLDRLGDGESANIRFVRRGQQLELFLEDTLTDEGIAASPKRSKKKGAKPSIEEDLADDLERPSIQRIVRVEPLDYAKKPRKLAARSIDGKGRLLISVISEDNDFCFSQLAPELFPAEIKLPIVETTDGKGRTIRTVTDANFKAALTKALNAK